jgi:uncharacterized protein YegP (UPF0339 family)
MKFKIKASGDQFYLVMRAKNGETLGHTENYSRKETAQRCAEILKAEAGEAEIVDETGLRP